MFELMYIFGESQEYYPDGSQMAFYALTRPRNPCIIHDGGFHVSQIMAAGSILPFAALAAKRRGLTLHQ